MNRKSLEAGSDREFDILIQEDRVHRSLYTDDRIFELEMDRIFGRTWVYVGHASEVSNVGDYKTTRIGRQPVVLTKSEDGDTHVLLNRCLHRGSVVCQQREGNANYFRCPYHGWTYNNSGDLVGVPDPKGAPATFDKRNFGLVKVPRVAEYRGLIFASMSPEGVDLPSYLGQARPYLDKYFLSSEIALTAGCNRHEYPANWKLQLEGGVDGYHARHLHQAWFAIHNATPDRVHAPLASRRAVGYAAAFENGHALNIRRADEDAIQLFRQRQPEYAAALEAQNGSEYLVDLLTQVNLIVFPNLHLAFDNLRVITPISRCRTQVSMHPMVRQDAPREFNYQMLREHEEAFGAGGFIVPDDFEAFVMVQDGLEVESVPWLLMDRGLEHEEFLDNGEVRGALSSDTPQRGIYREYRRLMAGQAS